MNVYVEKGYITELEYGVNFAYVLSDSSAFSFTEYKVLQSQTDSCFVKCMKMLWNGKVQLYYLTDTLKPLTAMLPTLGAEDFMVIVENLFADIIQVKHNGFLSCQNIDISFDRIYVNSKTYQVSLVYLPINEKLYEDNAEFENEVRAGLVKLISGVLALSASKTMQLASDLSNGMLTLENVYDRIKGSRQIRKPDIVSGKQLFSASPRLYMVPEGESGRSRIVVDKDVFVIGRKPELCDAVVESSKEVSRTHCRILQKDGTFFVEDLQSKNGTYVNGIQLQPKQSHSVKDGDRIRLAWSEYRIKMDEGDDEDE